MKKILTYMTLCLALAVSCNKAELDQNTGTGVLCMDMKLSTPEGVLRALKTLEDPITVTEEERLSALRPLEKMLEMCQ